MSDDSEMQLTTSLFGIKIRSTSLVLMLFFAIVIDTAATVWHAWDNNQSRELAEKRLIAEIDEEGKVRRAEHDRMLCYNRLNLFTYTVPKGTQLDWTTIPADLYDCMPKFLIERPIQK